MRNKSGLSSGPENPDFKPEESTPLFHALPQPPQSKPDDLSALQPEFTFQPPQIAESRISQPDSCHLRDLLHASTVNEAEQSEFHSANVRHTKGLQEKPKIPDSVTAKYSSPQLLDVPVRSAVSALTRLLNPEKPKPVRAIELQGDTPENIHNRIASRIVQLETHEPEAEFRDSYRCSWLIVNYCFTGEAVLCTPHELASYRVFGCHPDQVWRRTIARRQAMLGHPTFFSPRKLKPSPVIQKQEKQA